MRCVILKHRWPTTRLYGIIAESLDLLKSLKFNILCNDFYPEDGGSVRVPGGVVIFSCQCTQYRTPSMTNPVVQNPAWDWPKYFLHSDGSGRFAVDSRRAPSLDVIVMQPKPSYAVFLKVHFNITWLSYAFSSFSDDTNKFLYASLMPPSHFISYFEQAAVFWNLRVSRDRPIQLGKGRNANRRARLSNCLLVTNLWVIIDHSRFLSEISRQVSKWS
jgi:hypothetical protein